MPQEQRISEPEGIFQDQLILPSHFTDVKTSSEMGMAGWHHRACPHTPCSGLQGHAALEMNPHGVPNRQRPANIVVPWMPDSEMTLPVKLPKQSSPCHVWTVPLCSVQPLGVKKTSELSGSFPAWLKARKNVKGT